MCIKNAQNKIIKVHKEEERRYLPACANQAACLGNETVTS